MAVPTLGCSCAVCASAYQPGSPNRRTRPSVLLSYGGRHVVIDTGQDFQFQAVRERLMRLDAVLYTHGHADHILGMDDLRPLSFQHADGLPLYADDATAAILERIFAYTFSEVARYPTRARVTLHRIPAETGFTVTLFGASFIRVPLIHGPDSIAGYRFGDAAYLTDMSEIPEESFPLLQDLDILVLDALRPEPHPSHSHLAKSVELVKRIRPRRAFFTHISHGLEHEATNARLPNHIRLAHDGLKLTFRIAE